MDYFSALRIFHDIAQTQSFTLTAKRLGVAVSSVTRQMDNLEQNLGISLLKRSTRQLNLTYAGEQYLAKTRHILADLATANLSLKDEMTAPQGKLRFTFPMCYGNTQIAPFLAEFAQKYPKIELELFGCDETVDLFAIPIDLALRLGKVEDERLVARWIKGQERWLCVSPDYAAKHGIPNTPQELNQHNCLPFIYPNQFPKWHFYQGNKNETVLIKGNLFGNSIEMLMQACKDGLGISLLPDWLAKHDIAAGQLLRLLPDWQVSPNPYLSEDGISLVYLPNNRQIAKVKLLADFLAERLGG
ncbi:LysR family transcriptional regulator [Mannheimia massilioguelmaensis]|uniref:LysR family transcriptional regulator n=1 Tax=Mannheimia massilioguelmaensis TaxID=1604354 RepID=UPI0005C8AD76|nr:LysR family transcriptional regulator [Mannheimia massilioguelmaensis]